MAEISGTGSTDTLVGGEGDDRLTGYNGDDTLDGRAGNDVLDGGNGNDVLIGGAGDDALNGGDGHDVLDGGAGFDSLHGGHGNDTYYVRDLTDHIHDRGGNDTAIVSSSYIFIPSFIENLEYVEGAIPLPYWISALLDNHSSGSFYSILLGEEKTIRYAFPADPPSYLGSTTSSSGDSVDLTKGYARLTSTQQRNFQNLLNDLEFVIDVNFVNTTNAYQGNTIAIGLYDASDGINRATIPSEFSYGSDIFINNSGSNSTLNAGTRGSYVVVHELGHALGLKHPFDDAPHTLSQAEDRSTWTMMSYNESPNDYKLAFSDLDIAALQYLYGPSKKARIGDDTYIYDFSSPNFIWDGGGEDTIDAASSTAAVTIYLEHLRHGFNSFYGKENRITGPGQITVNFGTEIENLIGSRHDDTLIGNHLANEIHAGRGADVVEGKEGSDSLFGQFGDDLLDGGAGNDRLHGGSGADTLVGGDGVDFAIYDENRSDVLIVVTEDRIVVEAEGNPAGNSPDLPGRDTLSGVERLMFPDVNLAFDLDGNAGAVLKLLAAFRGPQGHEDPALFGVFLNLFDIGLAYDNLLQLAIDTFIGSDADGTAMVDHYYSTVTGMKTPEDISTYWGALVDSGELSAVDLAAIVAEHDLNLANIDFVGLSSTGVEYVLA